MRGRYQICKIRFSILRWNWWKVKREVKKTISKRLSGWKSNSSFNKTKSLNHLKTTLSQNLLKNLMKNEGIVWANKIKMKATTKYQLISSKTKSIKWTRIWIDLKKSMLTMLKSIEGKAKSIWELTIQLRLLLILREAAWQMRCLLRTTLPFLIASLSLLIALRLY